MILTLTDTRFVRVKKRDLEKNKSARSFYAGGEQTAADLHRDF